VLESIYTDAFIYSRLSTDGAFTTALGGAKIYRGRVPQGVTGTVFIFRMIDSDDVLSGNKQVRLIARSTYELATRSTGFPVANDMAAANRADELFRNVRRVSFTVGGVTLSFNSWRELQRPTQSQGARPDEFFVTNGGLYTFEAFTAE
jgi:hypothetical protein